MDPSRRKQIGAYYTPDEVVRSLVSWAVSSTSDRMLDPSCGDGRFLVVHPNSVGVEGDPAAASIVHQRAPGCLIHQGDFFSWAASTTERFECAAGNPPFIRYQRFTGEVREASRIVCARHGVRFTSLSSSWAPFLVATASLLKPGGRMAFVVPAEIGHAPYAIPLLRYLLGNFSEVKIIAVEEKLFPDLSEDCWLLYCHGFGSSADSISFRHIHRFKASSRPLRTGRRIGESEWEQWGCRLRPFVLPDTALNLYVRLAASASVNRLDDVARVGIGYVSGDNEFFHFRPSEADRLSIPLRFLSPTVRSSRDLLNNCIDTATIETWKRADKPNFLLRLRQNDALPGSIRTYLDSQQGRDARQSYKCRNRTPWYVVPDVHCPDGFLSYMSGQTPILVANRTNCVATNSVHLVRMKSHGDVAELQRNWDDPLTQLSCELEGHPLGGGMLKLEPREAGRILIRPCKPTSRSEVATLEEGTNIMRRWRHYG